MFKEKVLFCNHKIELCPYTVINIGIFIPLNPCNDTEKHLNI